MVYLGKNNVFKEDDTQVLPKTAKMPSELGGASDGIFTQAEQCPALPPDRAPERQTDEN
ncbi:hypothetical protein MM809_29230 [Klebsiella pneumoniae]|nr:hypothetical protein [Klebsiella pneumoniae]